MNAETKNNSQTPAQDAGLTKFDQQLLKSMESTALVEHNGLAFLPATMAQAMELAKLMASGTVVPPHLRGNPGDCLAIVFKAGRWGMDPYAVAEKTYFVNNRIAYEAQLVDAVLNTSRAIEGRLKLKWDGTGEQLTVKVWGKAKNEPEILEIWQELNTITTRNSPLWKQSPRQQIGYYGKRLWARLHTPEVLLGVYTPDELYAEEQRQADGSYVAAPARPTRSTTRDVAQARQQGAQLDQGFRAAMGRDTGDDPEEEETEDQSGAQPGNDGSSGDQGAQRRQDGDEDTKTGPSENSEAAAIAASEKAINDLVALVTKLIGEQGFNAGVEAVLEQYGSDLDWLKEVSPEKHEEVFKVISAKREKLNNRGRRK